MRTIQTIPGTRTKVTLSDGLYETTAYAYDANGRLIDKASREYVIYYEWKFVLIKQLLGIQSY